MRYPQVPVLIGRPCGNFSGALQDLAERFTLIVALLFVIGEERAASSSFAAGDGQLVRECIKIFATEILVDVLKHSSLAKFNDVRPGMYREFFRCATT